ncbi:MAG: Chromate resistance protein ChrB [Actinomycetota bacterium]
MTKDCNHGYTSLQHMVGHSLWVFLAYRLPREPSTPRIALWRKLKRLGAVQLLDGLVALPLDARNREQLEWLAEDIVEAGGEASIWKAQPTTAGQERRLVDEMQTAIAAEYKHLTGEARTALREPTAARRRVLSRLRKEIRRIQRRDYFPPPEREWAKRAVERLGTLVEAGR